MNHEFSKRRLEKLINSIDNDIIAVLLLLEDIGIVVLKRKGKDWDAPEDIYRAAAVELGLDTSYVLQMSSLYEDIASRHMTEFDADAYE